MNCQTINGLKLDHESIQAIEEIRRKQRLSNYLAGALSAGILGNILLTNYSLISAVNIYQTDFQLYAKAMQSVPMILRNEVEKIASRQLLRSLDSKQRMFWQGIYYGCN